MSTPDREHAAPDADANLPIEDLSPGTLEPKTADQVRGGADATGGKVHTSDIVVVKVHDATSPL